MKVECVGKGFVYTWPGGRVTLEPGKPIDLPPERAAKLMAKVPGRVRLVEQADSLLIDSGTSDAKIIYFFRASAGAILGPAWVDFATKAGDGTTAQYWLFVTYDGLPTSINATQLRSHQEFETQVRLKPVEIIKEWR